MIKEVLSESYGCFLMNFGSFFQIMSLGFTGIHVKVLTSEIT
jgi:hypothetical protein